MMLKKVNEVNRFNYIRVAVRKSDVDEVIWLK